VAQQTIGHEPRTRQIQNSRSYRSSSHVYWHIGFPVAQRSVKAVRLRQAPIFRLPALGMSAQML